MPGNRQATTREEDHALLRAAVREAGALAGEYFGRPVEHWRKQNDTPVSEADLAVNRLLKARLGEARPGYGWLSEETEDSPERLSRDRVWVADPIDGTRAFLKGRPHWTISVALVEHGCPVSAVVFNPVREEFFEATAGGGATLNGRAIAVSKRAEIEHCRMIAHARVFRRADWPSPWPPMRVDFRNSMAYRLSLVAAGAFDATFTISPKSDWDIAAADLLVREAGGRVTSRNGETLVYNRPGVRHDSVLAAGPALHRNLLALSATPTRRAS